MNVAITNPLVSFLICLGFAVVLYLIGRYMAGSSEKTSLKSSTYASGEAPPAYMAAPGYRPFFTVALFFAILHLGALVLASGGLTLLTGIYLAGLFLALLALILG